MTKRSVRRTTTKKTKVVGTQTYIDKNSGEIVEMDVISIEEKDFNFMKFFLVNLLNQIDQVGNKKTQVMFYIIDKLDKNNMLFMTQTEIAEETGIGRKTVNEAFKILEECDFIKKIRDGKYQINPNSVFKGGIEKRRKVLLDYKAIGADDKNDN